ncbi:hypothetical protein CL629_04865 [bacterium]|nr:hypothetical protein [bacterium]
MQTETKTCQNCKADFVIESDDFAFYEKVQVPPPTFCPDCRYQRRLMFRNERALYKRKCDLCEKDMVSSFSPDKPYTVYCNPCWYSDKWDQLEFGQDYDPNKKFFDQLKELTLKTPFMSLIVDTPNLVNSEYLTHAGSCKNCYLICNADFCENVLYSEMVITVKDSMDVIMCGESQLCYQIVNTGKSSRVFFSEDCQGCQDVYFSKDLIGCDNCFGCSNLRKQKYHIWNEPYTKEEYEEKIKEFKLDSYKSIEELKKKAREHWLKYPNKFMHGRQNKNSSGEYVFFSKNSKNTYRSRYAEDTRYCQMLTIPSTKDSYDLTEWGNGAELIYDTITSGEGTSNIKFCFAAWNVAQNVEYSMHIITSKNIFGCTSLRNKEFCILNKKYSEEEYKKLREQIIKDMNESPYTDSKGRVWKYGEFLPYDISTFKYNESTAKQYFPMTKEEALEKGWQWHDQEPSKHKPTIKAKDIPDSIKYVSDNMLKEIIECEECNKAFKIIKPELELLRRFGFPLPRKCPDCRHDERMTRVNKQKLHKRKCQCAGEKSDNNVYQNTTSHIDHEKEHCPNEFETAYSPDREEIVYCEKCYQGEVS